MADPSTSGSYGYWSMFGPDPDPTSHASPAPALTLPTSAPAPDPVYHSVVTGTFDPTPAEIIAAAAAAGIPVPSGVDPVEFSRMMSGLPATPTSTHVPVMPSAVLPSAPIPGPHHSIMSLMSLPDPTAITGSFPSVSGSPLTAAMKDPSFDGGGGILCDPITGKCPQYR